MHVGFLIDLQRMQVLFWYEQFEMWILKGNFEFVKTRFFLFDFNEKTGKYLLWTKNVSKSYQKHSLCLGDKFCFHDNYPRGGKQGNICVRNNVPSFANTWTLRTGASFLNFCFWWNTLVQTTTTVLYTYSCAFSRKDQFASRLNIFVGKNYRPLRPVNWKPYISVL